MNTFRRSCRLRPAAAAAALLIATALAGCSSDDAADGGASTPAPGSTSTVPSAPLWAPPGTDGLPAADRMQAALDEWVAAGTLDGVTAAVVTPDGRWSGAAGVDSAGSALQPDSAMSIMSVTKTYTAAELMLLSSRGVVDLDAPVTDYVSVPFDTGGATVRQVMGMRSGFPAKDPATEAELIAADLQREWTPDEWLATIPEDATGFGELGGESRYNGVNYVVLAAIIEAVTETPFGDAIRTDLLAPAGLERTWAQPTEVPTAPLTVGGQTPHADVVDPASAVMPSVSLSSALLGAGSMAADAADAAMWGYLLYGGQVIDAALVEEMLADPQPDPYVGSYSLGAMQLTVGTDELVGHAGGGTDYPYTCTMDVVLGETPVAIAILAPEAADHATQMFDLYMELYRLALA
jgi:D-alanyl-D-alanine carboxypeptidase